MSQKLSPETRIQLQLKKIKWLSGVLINPQLYDIIDNGIFQDSAKLDATLSTVCYSFLFISEALKLKPMLVKRLVKIFPILGEKNGLFTLRASLTQTEETISQKLKLVSSYLSDIRIFNRMWAALPLMSWLLSTYYKILTVNSKKYPLRDKVLDFVQVTSCLLLQIFENVGFVGDHHFTTQSDLTSLWFNIWCCKLWALYVVSDIVKILSAGKIDKKGLVSNLANLPLTVHWSIEEGCLSPLQVGFFGTFSSCLNTIEYWKEVLVKIRGLP